MKFNIRKATIYKGGKRGQIEGVRVDQAYRGQGIGKLLAEWAVIRLSFNSVND